MVWWIYLHVCPFYAVGKEERREGGGRETDRKKIHDLIIGVAGTLARV